MRVGVIRGDLPGPILFADLEPVSRYNPSTEPRGQEVYVSRPTVAEVEGVLSNSTYGAGATLAGGDISGSFPLAINGTNDDLRLRLAAGDAFTVLLIPQTTYATLADLVAGVNSVTTPFGVLARTNVAGNGVALESLTKGVNSYIENDTVANGSVANTPLSLADGAVRTMPSAATFITDLLPVGGPLDVALATINGVGAGTNANALSLIPTSRGTQEALADAIAPQFVESTVAIDSFLVGYIADLLNANFNPDSRRVPALANGAAIEVVEDDGSTAFATAHALPVVTTAEIDSPTAGDVEITGTNLASAGSPSAEIDEVAVRFFGPGTDAQVGFRVSQALILATTGGVVTSTSIIIPAALLPGTLVTSGPSGPTQVQTRIRRLASNAVDLTT